MNWQEIIKADYESKDSTQGLHVTKFYMFLKRYFASTHTSQFLKYYIPYDELDDRGRQALYRYLYRLLGIDWNTSVKYGQSYNRAGDKEDRDLETFPGIEIFNLTNDDIHLVFNDNKHISERDKWIESTYEHRTHSNAKDTNQTYTPWWVKKPPYDSSIQSAWNSLKWVIKRKNNNMHNWRW
tara:strand:+ start:1015 stop:1560 length:546 start_codon:yes stop_codon:yes gene_type:complete